MEIKKFDRYRHLLLCLVTAFAITACGGGGGGSSSPPPPPPVSQAPEEEESNTEQPETEDPEDTSFSAPFLPYTTFEQRCENPRSGLDSAGRAFPDIQGEVADENNWIRAWSHELYLWYDEIIDVDPESLPTPEYFEKMKTPETTASGAPKDKFHFTLPTDEWIQISQAGVSAGYGATFAILSSSPPRQVVVAYTQPNSPATAPETNLRRGDTILEIDGVSMIDGSDLDTLNNGLFPGNGETHSFVIENQDGTQREITMTSGPITETPVQNVSILETNNGLVGYMTFNDHIATSEALLINAMEQFRDANISDLILDLRYNGGGFLDIASELGYMIAGPQAATGRVFENLQFSDKHPDFNPVTGEQLVDRPFKTTTQGFSVNPGSPLPTINLPRLFVLTGPRTCSASESLMNGLRGIDIEIIQIGNTTCGKPYGFYPFDNCGTTYFSIQFGGVNEKGFGEYSDGFSPANITQPEGVELPGCLVSDDFTRQLGDPLEGMTRAALQYREDTSCPLTTARLKPAARVGWQNLGKANADVAKFVNGKWVAQP